MPEEHEDYCYDEPDDPDDYETYCDDPAREDDDCDEDE